MKNVYKVKTKGFTAKRALKLLQEGFEDKTICQMLGLKPWRLERIRQRFERRIHPYARPVDLNVNPYDKYYAKMSPYVISWLLKKQPDFKNGVTNSKLVKELEEETGVKVSKTTMIKALKQNFRLTYKKSYRIESRANYIEQKRKRQMASALYANIIAEGREVINIDESAIQVTFEGGRMWGPANEKIIDARSKRLDRI